METLSLLQWVFDVVLGLTLLWLAWRILASEDLFKAIVLFIAFGLLMALTWVRLNAPDIALAEVAIGAGLTGALLLAALAKLDVHTAQRLISSEDEEASAEPELQPNNASLHD